MIHINTLSKKLLGITLAGVFAATPILMSSTAAQADPPRHAPAWGRRDKDRGRHDDHRRGDRDRNRDRRDYRTFTGTVDGVDSNSKFELRSGGRTYDVYVSGRLPRGLDRHDVVRVYGYRYGNNDIRNAHVTVIRNR